MDNLKVKNFGPILEADVAFGDLTFFVGPQASGKSILLQLMKLVADNSYITNTLIYSAYIWNNKYEFLDRYFGEGMSQIWNNESKIFIDGDEFSVNDLATLNRVILKNERESVFYIPAQRVLTLENGWPRSFKSFGVGDPFVIKNFSETMRQYVELGGSIIFQKGQNPLKDNNSYKEIFYSGEIELDRSAPTKRIVLKINGGSLPFMAWSTGQKESMPLQLSFAFLRLPSLTLTGVKKITVIIEEPEMGLHPKAIVSVIFQIVELISMGYKVIISTHSPVFLEFAWAFQFLKKSKAKEEAFCELFELPNTAVFRKLFKNMLSRNLNTYYFERENEKVTVKDISSLDAGSNEKSVSEWGSLSSFAGKAGDVILKYLPNE